jgi:hypothetical protein
MVFQKQNAQKRNRVRHMYTFKNDFILYTKAKFGIKFFNLRLILTFRVFRLGQPQV